MPVDLTREELYNRVWSKPMVHVAADLGISDVMLAKLCKQKDVPRPQRGYWANLSSPSKNKRYIKPTLPDHASDPSNFERFINAHYEQRYQQDSREFDWQDLTVAIPSPPDKPINSLDEQAGDLFGKLPKLPAFETYKKIHPIAAKFLEVDRRKDPKSPYSWEKQIFSDDNGKRLFEKLNGFAWTLEKLGASMSLTGRVHIATYFRLLNRGSQFVLCYHDPEPRVWDYKRRKVTSPKRLRIHFSQSNGSWGSTTHGGKAPEDFSVEDVRQIIKKLIWEREENHRKSVVGSYEYDVQSRNNLIASNERKRLMLLQKERERLAALELHRKDTLLDAVTRMTQSDQIRSLVAQLDNKQMSKGKKAEGFERWSRWALQYADELDPRRMSIGHVEAWICKFK